LKDDQYENTDIFYPDWEKIDSCIDGEENYIYQTSDHKSTTEDSSQNNDEMSKSTQSTLEMLEVDSDDNDSHVSDLSDETDSD